MLVVYNETHRQHQGAGEFFRGEMVPCYENPRRIDSLAVYLDSQSFAEFTEASRFGQEPIARVHDASYLDFLANAYGRWIEVAGDCDAIPHAWIGRGLHQGGIPTDIHGQLGYYASDAGTPITSGTWKAVQAASDATVTAAQLVRDSDRSVFALTRPPGHHAGKDVYGGYCFLNFAAIGAQSFLDHGAKRVAILDIDFHHGNGTQAIFYDRSDVLFVSIHGDPSDEYPYFLGYSDEFGMGDGEGFNVNLPLAPGADWSTYGRALTQAIDRIADYSPDRLVVSLGVDTFEHDPISRFQLKTEDFTKVGTCLAQLDLPKLIIFEGGYNVEHLGVNVANVLRTCG